MKCTSNAKCPLCGGNSNMKTFDVKGHNDIEVEWECPFCGAEFETFVDTYKVNRQKMEITFGKISGAIRLRYHSNDDPGQSPMEHINPSKRNEE